MANARPKFNEKISPGIYRIKPHARDAPYLHMYNDQSPIGLARSDPPSANQQWSIVPVEGETNTYYIKSSNNQYILSAENPTKGGHLVAKEGLNGKWLIQRTYSGGWSIGLADVKDLVISSKEEDKASLEDVDQESYAKQLWIFERADKPEQDDGRPSQGHTFQSKFFPLTPEDAAKEQYDIIIVGTGVGGGILAHDLNDTNFRVGPNYSKKVLLLERGGFTFHSHCLNTARPVDLVAGRGQHNDFYFRRFWQPFNVKEVREPDEEAPKIWDGGPMYNLGGRSAAWGLFIPRIHDRSLQENFSESVCRDLLDTYYAKADHLMNLSLPQTKKIHRQVIDRLNADGLATLPNSQIQWNWARIASEFQGESNFNFAQGAYSTIDKIFEIVQGKDNPDNENDEDGNTKHPQRKIDQLLKQNLVSVLDAEVYSLVLDRPENQLTATGVNVRTLEGDCVPIFLKPGGKVVLAAGSVNSPTILLRSGGEAWRANIRDEKIHRGLRLTDHAIWIHGSRFRYKDPSNRERYGPMKLQSYFSFDPNEPNGETLRQGTVGLANMSIDSSSFLPRGSEADPTIPNFIMAFILECPLKADNTITIDDKTGEPKVTISRGRKATSEQLSAMYRLTLSARNTIETTLGATFTEPPPPEPKKLYHAGLGIVAHELGTLPMPWWPIKKGEANKQGDNQKQGASQTQGACLDDQLKVVSSICDGVYVCDLSIFPYSPEVNPTLTLAALAIRLSRHLLNRSRIGELKDYVRVVNHSGAKRSVRLSNFAGGPDSPQSIRSVRPKKNEDEEVTEVQKDVEVKRDGVWFELQPGDAVQWERKQQTAEPVAEALLIRSPTGNEESSTTQPGVISALPGAVTVIGSD